jgi:hypothetical protein
MNAAALHSVLFDFAPEALAADAKNYHAWAHRQVVVAAAGAWQQELEYVDQLLRQDVRNNSAWNQRGFVLQVTLLMHDGAQLGMCRWRMDGWMDGCNCAWWWLGQTCC